jgi:helix-turn-helix, Psq domain
MDLLPAESRVIMALEAIKNNEKLSVRAAAKLYNVSDRTIRHRRDGHPARRDTPANSNKLTNLEERTIIQYILELNSRSFPPRLSGVEDMANQLLRVRNEPPVGKNWASNFVRRQPELRTRYAR